MEKQKGLNLGKHKKKISDAIQETIEQSPEKLKGDDLIDTKEVN